MRVPLSERVAPGMEPIRPGPQYARDDAWDRMVLEAGERGGLIVFSTIARLAASGGGQRPAWLAKALAKRRPVVYLNDMELTYRQDGLIVGNFERFRSLVGELPRDDVVYVSSYPGLWDRTYRLPGGWLKVFDLCDDWRAFFEAGHGFSLYPYQQDRAVKEADLVTCSAQRLVEIAREDGARDARLVRNGGVGEPFREGPVAPDGWERGEINVVYLGSCWGAWFDWPPVQELADGLRQCGGILHIVGDKKAAERRHLSGPNIRWYGERPWADAMEVVVRCDVGIIPFADCPITWSVDAVKYYDYVAARIPVVVTAACRQHAGRPFVSVAREGGMLAAVEKAFEASPISQRAAERFCRQECWDRRAETILEAIDEHRKLAIAHGGVAGSAADRGGEVGLRAPGG